VLIAGMMMIDIDCCSCCSSSSCCCSYHAVYDYSPRNDDEMCLVEDDKVEVMEQCVDGWYDDD